MTDNFTQLSDANSLMSAFDKARRGSDWKESVQRYGINLLTRTLHTQKELRSGRYTQRPFYEFDLNERGKTRHIKSLFIDDRVVQRSVCDNALVPAVSPFLIYDNGASLKDKGVSFTRKRLVKHLADYIRHNGTEGYILLLDFAKFFDNIPHQPLTEALAKHIQDERTMALVAHEIDAFKIDVSYMTDEEYAHAEEKPFNSLEYEKADKAQLDGTKWLYRSVGIGSQNSQIAGVFYPTPIDNYCKTVMRCKYYGRYMDDIYVIHHDKRFLAKLQRDIAAKARELGMFVNERKTHIVKLSRGFTFMQVKYTVTAMGRIVRRLSPKAVTRERRKLKRYKHLLDTGQMPLERIETAYKSWRGNALQFNSYQSITRLDELYKSLFMEVAENDTRGTRTEGMQASCAEKQYVHAS